MQQHHSLSLYVAPDDRVAHSWLICVQAVVVALLARPLLKLSPRHLLLEMVPPSPKRLPKLMPQLLRR
jgi:hypothetical protein